MLKVEKINCASASIKMRLNYYTAKHAHIYTHKACAHFGLVVCEDPAGAVLVSEAQKRAMGQRLSYLRSWTKGGSEPRAKNHTREQNTHLEIGGGG